MLTVKLSVSELNSRAIVKVKMSLKTRRLLQDRGILSRIFETAATVRLQVGVMLVHER